MPRPKSRLERMRRKIVWFFTVYIGKEHDAEINTLNGKLSFNSKDRTLGRSLYLDREFEYGEMRRTLDTLTAMKLIENPKEKCVMDVGGYVGMISIGFVLNGLFKSAVTFEPNPRNYYYLKKNVKLNGIEDRIQIFNLALSDEDATQHMELSEKNYGDHRIRLTENQGNGHFQEDTRVVIDVASRTLDSLMDTGNIPEIENLGLVWMDIQGHEEHFFRGARAFFGKHKSVPVVTEFWPYGLSRAGSTSASFADSVSIFDSFVILEASPPTMQCNKIYSIGEIARVYDLLESIDGGSHILFFNSSTS